MSMALLYSTLYCTADRMLHCRQVQYLCLLADKSQYWLDPSHVWWVQVRNWKHSHFTFQWVGALKDTVHLVHKGLCPLPMSGNPAACNSVFKLLITSSVSRLLRGFIMYFSGPAPVRWQNWTPGALFLTQASLITSCARNLGKLGFWSAAMPEFLDQSKKPISGNVALIMSSCLYTQKCTLM